MIGPFLIILWSFKYINHLSPSGFLHTGGTACSEADNGVGKSGWWAKPTGESYVAVALLQEGPRGLEKTDSIKTKCQIPEDAGARDNKTEK